MQYDNFVVGVEGTWDLPESHPFEATFRVVFEKATVENAGGKFMLYTAEEAKEIVHTVRFQPLGLRPVDGGNADGLYCKLDFKEYIKFMKSKKEKRKNL